MFFDHPATGGGPGVFETLDIDTPHNYYLYALSELGLLSLLFLVIVLRASYRSFRLNPQHTALLAPILILTLFNDRFMNFNPYPLCLYVFLFGLSNMRLRERRR